MSSVNIFAILVAGFLSLALAYPRFQTQIPNGDRVPNPCDRSMIWPGVGHQNSGGGGPRNPFGLDFNGNDFTWNRTLCEKDSDGDGLTNGQELGDPDCVWTVGSQPARSSNLSHPGICEPPDSSKCASKNPWLSNCTPQHLDCPATLAPDVRNHTIRFPVTTIEATETTYICYKFPLLNDADTDIIAIEPVVDNKEVMHHMLLFGCPSDPTQISSDKPFICGMFLYCSSLIGIWSVGAKGQCLNENAGFRMGPHGFQYAILQLHWNNPQLKQNMTDSSGMRIYYTSNLRPNQGSVLIVGQQYIAIPPRLPEFRVSGSCTSYCTSKLPSSLFIISAAIHMHLLGISGFMGLYRNGNLVYIFDNVTNYDYNTPKMIEYSQAIEVKPGDEIRVTCVYRSTDRNATTIYGEATTDEMCFGFFAYYRLIPYVGFCGNWKSVKVCSSAGNADLGPCGDPVLLQQLARLPGVCSANHCTSDECETLLDEIYSTGCQNYTEVLSYMRVYGGQIGSIIDLLGWCLAVRPPRPPVDDSGKSHALSASTALILSLVGAAMSRQGF